MDELKHELLEYLPKKKNQEDGDDGVAFLTFSLKLPLCGSVSALCCCLS